MIPGILLGVPRVSATIHFGSHFHEQIDAKIDAEKVMKFHEKVNAKMRLIFVVF